MKDFIKEGALLVNEKNELDVSKKILEFIDNPCLREKKASIAFNEAKKFSYEKMTIQTLDFLHSL